MFRGKRVCVLVSCYMVVIFSCMQVIYAEENGAISGGKIDELLDYIHSDTGLQGGAHDQQLLEILTSRAEKGDPGAITSIGVFNMIGKQIPQNIEKAGELFKQAAGLGYEQAYLMLITLKVSKGYDDFDYDKAMSVAEKLAAQKDAAAVGLLGNMYVNGVYDPEDITELTSAMIAVANSGDTLTQYALGLMYLSGEGIEQNKSEGFRLLKAAADKHYFQAEAFLAVQCFYPTELVDIDYELAHKYALSAAEKGDVDSKLVLALGYYYGQGVDIDYNQAFYWMNQHVNDTGDFHSKLVLGRMYALGMGTEKNNKLAFELFSDAYENGVVIAAGDLGCLYLGGDGIERDYIKAKELLEICFENGYEQAGTNLGEIYQFGLGVEPNIETAIMWYKRAAAAGSTDAQERLDELLPATNE